MTMRITMRQTRMGESGSLLDSGSTYTVSDEFGAEMVGAGYATDTDLAISPPNIGGVQPMGYDPRTRSAVSGDGTPINLTPSGLWATRAALAAAGITSAFFTDVGVGGSFWFYAGGRWRPVGGRVTLKNLTTDVSNSAAPKVVLDYATLLAGVWQDGDVVRARIVKERTGGTSDTDATDVLLGTVPATLGTTLNLSTSALATTTISMAVEWAWRRISSTSVRSQGVPGSTGLGTSTAANSLITGLSNLDSVETYLQVSSDLTTAGGEVAWLRGYTVELIAGA